MNSKKVLKLQNTNKGAKKNENDNDSSSESESSSESDSSSDSDDDIEIKTDELEIQRMSQHEHILHRPDTFIGSTKRIKSSGKMWVKDGELLKCREVFYTEGLLRIFMEPACNVIDNIWRSKQYNITAKIFKITIDRDTGWFTMWNDGKPIPLDKFVEKDGTITDDYKPEVIFGQLLTSTNYNDDENRKTSGRNGLGAKATSIFSTNFEIELYNPSVGIYKQKWSNNMFDKNPPSIDKKKSNFPKGLGKTGYTLIKWKPDYKRFEMNGLDDDFMSIVEKSVYDYALIAGLNGVTTFYNGKELGVLDLKSYANLYYKEPPTEIIQFKSNDCTVILAPKADPLFKGDLMHVSFMNGILTSDGGVHVDAWEEAIFRPIINKINKIKPEKEVVKKKAVAKGKKTVAKKPTRPTIDITHVRKYFSIFVVAEANNPTFRGQNKTYFNGPNININVKRADISKLMKWSFVDRIEDSIRFKELSVLKDAGKKKRNFTRIEGLDDANNAGDKKLGKNCILTLTEGDSAATYVVNGMKYGIQGKKGHDDIGVYPLRGKLLNVRKASIATILKNKEITSVIKALGLEYGTDYTILENRNKLRYGKLYVIADGDYDGAHITGLVYNVFDTLFPTLLDAGDFFHFLRIPIVKINTKEVKLSFLFYHEAQQYIQENKPTKKSLRYFKGLGTSNKLDVKEDFGRYPVSVIRDEKGIELMQQVFDDEDADFRKEWLLNYKPTIKERIVEDYKLEELTISEFLNEEMINYSIDSCSRAIACVLDGLKESLRKVLCAAFKKKLTYNKKSLKVAQFAGYVAEHMGYHHGEQNLYDTITKMGQRFPGSNNIPLFYADGQFGSRRGGGNNNTPGKDAAKARYLLG
jgi:DNA topoisomerase-2